MNTIRVAGALTLSLMLFTAGCPTGAQPDPNEPTLTQTENDATKAGVRSAESIAQAVAPVPTIAVNTVAPPTAKSSRALDFGTCPVTSITLGNDPASPFNFNLSSDFSAEGCKPEGEGSFTCSGVLVGSLEFLSKTVTFTFGGITCAEHLLEGTAVLTYGVINATQISADGTLDMSATKAGEKTDVDGNVETTYDTAADTTTIDTFSGVVSDGATQRNCTMTACVVNFKANQNFIPSSGTMELTGDRKVLITFNADSPSTGNVQVSIDGGAAFTVNVFDL